MVLNMRGFLPDTGRVYVWGTHLGQASVHFDSVGPTTGWFIYKDVTGSCHLLLGWFQKEPRLRQLRLKEQDRVFVFDTGRVYVWGTRLGLRIRALRLCWSDFWLFILVSPSPFYVALTACRSDWSLGPTCR